MAVKSTRSARIIFSLMVPLTVGAFLLGTLVEATIFYEIPDIMELIALVLVGLGVWLYNWFEEKPQKASIESI